MKKIHRNIIVALIPIFLLGLLICGRELLLYAWDGIYMTSITTTNDSSRKAIFVNRGNLQGWQLLLVIIDPSTKKDYQILGVVSDMDGPHQMLDAIVSTDGYVVAVQSINEKWTYAYDFSTATPYCLEYRQYYPDNPLLISLHEKIQSLLNAHGGIGKKYSWDSRDKMYNLELTRLSWREWRHWKKVVYNEEYQVKAALDLPPQESASQ